MRRLGAAETLACGFAPPFAAVQIPWNNHVTAGVVTVNLALEPSRLTLS